MAEPTLENVFGGGASQTATSLTIEKADLAAVGLTASTTNTAESLLAAVAAKAKTALTTTSFASDLDQSVTVVDGLSSIISRSDGSGGFVSYRQTQINFNFHKADASGFNPDDY